METRKVKVKVKVVGRSTSLQQAFAHHMPLTRPPMPTNLLLSQITLSA